MGEGIVYDSIEGKGHRIHPSVSISIWKSGSLFAVSALRARQLTKRHSIAYLDYFAIQD
jgi:hypothetical protein